MTLLYSLNVFFLIVFGANLEHVQIESFDISEARAEIEVKSVLSTDSEKVFVALSLPESFPVGFEIYDNVGKARHLWNHQQLEAGRHDLSLQLPALSPGKYVLHILVGTDRYKHLVILP